MPHVSDIATKLEARATGTTAEVLIYGMIAPAAMGGLDETMLKDKLDALKNQGAKNLTLRIHSQGGSLWTGLAMSNIVRSASFASKTAVVDGECVSIATMIALAADRVLMHEDSFFMIHNPHGAVAGDADQLRKLADDMDKVKSVIVNAYQRKTGQPEKTIIDWMSAETWFSAADAKKVGFADDVIKPDVQNVAGEMQELLLNSYRNLPEKLRTTPQDLALARMQMKLLRHDLSRLVPSGRAAALDGQAAAQTNEARHGQE